jgi:hypothetical protein
MSEWKEYKVLNRIYGLQDGQEKKSQNPEITKS